MKKLNSDAKSFIDGIVGHLKKGAKTHDRLPKMEKLLRKVSLRSQKEHVARVYTTIPLLQSEKESLAKVLFQKTQYPVFLECMVKPSLIAGLRVEIGDSVIDLSFHEKLNTMKHLLLKGNAYEG